MIYGKPSTRWCSVGAGAHRLSEIASRIGQPATSLQVSSKPLPRSRGLETLHLRRRQRRLVCGVRGVLLGEPFGEAVTDCMAREHPGT